MALNTEKLPAVVNTVMNFPVSYTVIPRLTSDPANEFFG